MELSSVDYAARLTRWLRWRNVAPEEIADAVAVVRSHVHDTDADPWEVFGSPRSYAATFPRGAQPARHWRRYLLGLLVGSLAGALLVHALEVRGRGGRLAGDLDPVVGIVVAVVVLAAWAAALLRVLLHVDRGGMGASRR